jgi:hypothetical protein
MYITPTEHILSKKEYVLYVKGNAGAYIFEYGNINIFMYIYIYT